VRSILGRPKRISGILNLTTLPATLSFVGTTVRQTRRKLAAILAFVGTDYRQTVLGDGPALYWRLGESSGAVAVDEVGVNNGTYTGSGITYGQPALPNATRPNTSIALPTNTPATFVSGGNLALFGGATALTVEMWLNAAWNTTTSGGVWGKWTEGSQATILVTRGEGGNGGVFVDVAGAITDLEGMNEVVWNLPVLSVPPLKTPLAHLVVTYDGSQPTNVTKVRLYINGVDQGNALNTVGTIPTALTTSTAPFRVGTAAISGVDKSLYSNEVADPRIDEVAVYTKVLTPAQVANHYQTGLGKPVLLRQTSRTLTAVLSFIGTLAKQTQRLLTGVLSFIGVLILLRNKLLAATLSFIGAAARQGNKSLAATLPTLGAVTKFTSAARTGTLSFIGTTTKRLSHILAATLSLNGLTTMSKTFLRTLLATVSFVGSVTRQTRKAFVATLIFAKYRGVVMSDGPEHYWRLDETVGPTAVNYAGGSNATYFGTVTYGQTGAMPNDSNTAVTLDGASAYVEVAGVPSLVSDMTNFVQRSGMALTLAGRPFKFLGLNVYNANSDGGGTRGCWYDLQSGTLLDDQFAAIGSIKVMRAWFFQRFASNVGVRDWTYFDKTISVAKARGIRIIATLGNQWGDCESAPANVYHTKSWYATRYKTDLEPIQTYYAWIQAVATRYKNEPAILGWELLNEAEDLTTAGGACDVDAATVLKTWADDCASVVKVADPNHLVSVGVLGGGQCGSASTEYQSLHAGANIDLLSYHDYGSPSVGLPGDQWNGLQARIDQGKALNKPLYVGEMGINAPDLGIGSSLGSRAVAFESKFNTQLVAGISGMLAWNWRASSAGGSSISDYSIGPADPVLDVLRRYGTRSFTAEIWAKSAVANWNDNGFLLSSRDINGFILHPVTGTKQVSFYVLDSAGAAQLVGTATLADITVWHHYAATWDGTTGHLYIDGADVASGTPTAARTATTLTIDLGRDFGNRYLNGSIDEAAIYPTTLSAAQVARHYWAGTVAFGLAKQTARPLLATLLIVGTTAKQVRRTLTMATLAFVGLVSTSKTFVRTLLATLSFIGTQARQTSRGLSATLPLVGVATKFTSTTRIAMLSFVGTMTRQSRRALSGVLSFIGTLATVKAAIQLLVATLSFVGTLPKQTNRLQAATLLVSGTAAKQVQTARTAALSLVGATVKQVNRLQAGALSFVGLTTMSKTFLRTLLATVSFVGAVTKQIGRSFSATLPPIGTVAKFTSTTRTAVLLLVGTTVKQANRLLPGVLSLSGVVTMSKTFLRTLLATLSFIGTQALQTGKLQSATLSFAGTLPRQISRLQASTLSLIGTTTKQVNRAWAATVSFVGALSTARQFLQALLATLSLVGVATRQTGKAANGTLSFVGATPRLVNKALPAALWFIGALLRGNMPVRLSASLSFAGATFKSAQRTVAATLSFVGGFTGFRVIVTRTQVFLATLAFSGSTTRRTNKAFNAVMGLLGFFPIQRKLMLTATLGLVGTVSRIIRFAFPLRASTTYRTALATTVTAGAVLQAKTSYRSLLAG
jgi:hypothetical protein